MLNAFKWMFSFPDDINMKGQQRRGRGGEPRTEATQNYQADLIEKYGKDKAGMLKYLANKGGGGSRSSKRRKSKRTKKYKKSKRSKRKR